MPSLASLNVTRTMKRTEFATSKITTLFLDIGGVLLTNGWDRESREKAAQTFRIDYQEMDERHNLIFGAYEEGRLTLDEYLDRVIFFRNRPFTRESFRQFMFAQSRQYPMMFELIRTLKERYTLKIVAVNNEGQELNEYRIRKFDLNLIFDFFVSSCFVHHRKPDKEIYQYALDAVQAPPREILYIDDRLLFVEMAQELGIRGIRHVNFRSTVSELEKIGLFARDFPEALQA